MNEDVFQARKFEFVAPSGCKYTIREQNGADDDIISNPIEAQTLTNFSRFIMGIVVNTNATESGRLNLQQAHSLPSLDRYCILLNSRIFSLGNILEFEFDWGKENGGKVNYEQDLNELLFDYAQAPTIEELKNKPDAIPYYPNPDKMKDIEFTLNSGKILKFDVLTANGENYVINLPVEKRTKNQDLIARNLCLQVNGNWEKVQSFHLFSTREMMEIRKYVNTYDPIFAGDVEIENPNNPGQTTRVNIMGNRNFFFPGEI